MGIEKRRVRFASIQGIGREDLPLAAEVWHENLIGQIWTTRDVLKLATVFMHYMRAPREELVATAHIERTCHLDLQAMRDVLRQMQMFGAIECFAILDNAVHVSLSLSLLQRIRVLELRARIEELSGPSAMNAFLDVKASDYWTPPKSPAQSPEDERAEPMFLAVN